ncbi:MAG: haloalkane dehalogenase, partial [Deltaproteobacteria bacterium]|nr:haloalkane dehalogenase [Deltaproteobacteria bacterium]
MPLLRTPEERFSNIPDYPFAPHYLDWNGARIHYLDEGEGEVILCLHGEPSWSFLYRKMIPILARKGRVIAPDLIGFGKSDKFTEPDEYSIQMHRDSMRHLLDGLGLDRITLVGQDWGGMIGMRLLGEEPERFSRIVLANTGLATGDTPVPKGLSVWRDFIARSEDLDIGLVFRQAIIDDACKTDEIIHAYEAPFPDRSYKTGALRFPMMIPVLPDDPGAAEMRATREVLSGWKKPAFVAGSDQDMVLGVPAATHLAKIIPTAGDVVVIEGAG